MSKEHCLVLQEAASRAHSKVSPFACGYLCEHFDATIAWSYHRLGERASKTSACCPVLHSPPRGHVAQSVDLVQQARKLEASRPKGQCPAKAALDSGVLRIA